MGSQAESAVIVGALSGLGLGLGLTITAEGVESREQQVALLEQGCQQGQGFLFSKAIPALEVSGYLSRQTWRHGQSICAA
jgi:EAL domain-containing protein (putative c-di-GMP-specific phosphodiesterase class I)